MIKINNHYPLCIVEYISIDIYVSSQMFVFQYTIYDIFSIGSFNYKQFGLRIFHFRTDHNPLKTAGQEMEMVSLQKSVNLKIIEAHRQKVISRIKTKKLL